MSASGACRQPPPAEWWRRAVIYEIYVRSFADSDGDGIGDLTGVRQRLGYLRDLGVDAIWLTPFYRSPMIDGGYDVADYRDVDPCFGTLDDFEAMLATAHEFGLRVIVDIVPNHTSSRHPWFVEALAAGPGSPERERYLFRPSGPDGGPPNDWQSVFGGPAWTRAAGEGGGGEDRTSDGEWYLHLFDSSQPDLNWQSTEVRSEFESILRFWLDRGVDGFRVDVAHGLIKADGLPSVGDRSQARLLGSDALPYFDQDEVHEIYRSWRKILDSYPGDRMAVAEAWAPTPQRLARYVAPDELHQAFNFDFLKADWDAAGLRRIIDESLAATSLVGAPTTWVLSNHDKPRPPTRYGSLARARAAALLMLALPGSAYIYQGEELGLEEVLDLPDEAREDPVWFRSGGADPGRDGCRVPMPWSGTVAPYGFSTTTRTWLPQPPTWAPLSAAAQRHDPDSTLSLYRRALRLRRTCPPCGEIEWLDGPDRVLDFRCTGGGVRCVVNLSGTPYGLGAVPLLASGPLAAGGALPPDTAAWL